MIETATKFGASKARPAEDPRIPTSRVRAVSGEKSFEHVDRMHGHRRAVPEYEAGTVVVRAKTARLRSFPLSRKSCEIAAVYPS